MGKDQTGSGPKWGEIKKADSFQEMKINSWEMWQLSTCKMQAHVKNTILPVKLWSKQLQN
jgi:hypothetical protein